MPAAVNGSGVQRPELTSSPSSSAFLSANHPINLRKQAQPKLDSSFSVKMYIGAAHSLLEKASAAHAQGQLEVAFVNYLKAASVASFIAKHEEWPKIQKSRGSVYQAYHELMRQVPSFIERTTRIEEQLRIREDRNAQLQEEAANRAADPASQEEPQPPAGMRDPTPPSSEHGGHVRHGTDASPVDDHHQGLRTSNSLADRLQALRVNAATDSAEHRSRSRAGSVNEHTGFPAPPSHPVGTDRRPLPEPPSHRSADVAREFAVARDVPDPFVAPRRPIDGLPSPNTQHISLPASAPSPSLIIGTKPSPPLKNHVNVQELYLLLHPGFEEFTDADGARKIGKKIGLSVLFLDVRSRAEYETGRIAGGSSVCIEPITLREGMSSTEIQDKLVLSPQEEQSAFASRNQFDLVVLYDRNLRALRSSQHDPTPQDPKAQARMDVLIKAIYENEFATTLKQQPVLLVGGFDSWHKHLGDKFVHRERAPDASPLYPNGALPEAGDTLSQQQQDLKRARRQQQILPDSINGSAPSSRASAPAGSIHPGSLYPGRPPSSAYSGSNGFAADGGPSLPARAYQSPGVGNTVSLPTGAPSFPPSRSNSSGTFDYPQLKASGSPYASPQPPPTAASASTPAPTGHSARASISTPAVLTPGQDPSKKQVMAPGYAGHLTTQSRMYSNPTSGRGPDDIRIGMTGLKNLGNSCYMNSTLQCLSATFSLARFLLDGSYKKAINRTNPLGTQGALAEAFAQLVRVMWSEQYTVVSPITFRETMARFAPSFRGFDQHDSQEFLAILLDFLHEDLNYIVTRPPAIEMTPEREKELETLPQQIASLKEWGIYRMRNDSLIVDWFQGQFRNKLTCLTCGKTSTTYEAFTYLSLPVPHGRGVTKVTLEQCMDAFVREEVLEKGDMWNCPRCKTLRRATKRLSISRLPQVLLIHLKRFSFKGPFTDKIDTTVTFKTSALDLTNYMPPPLPPGAVAKGMPVSQSQQPPYLYDLYGVTHHFGSLNTGHYTATIRNNADWWYCDDSRVAKGDDRQLHTNSPYVLWFRRRS